MKPPQPREPASHDLEVHAVPSFPMRWLTAAIALTVGVLLAKGWFAFDSYRSLAAAQLHDLRLAELRGTIIHLDEVLTMSARMAATTGDLQWEQRYRRFETPLDHAVKETMQLTTLSASAEAARQTHEANLKLVEMENQSFALVRAGRAAEAKPILFSDAYEAQKKIYAAGTTTLLQDIKTRLATSQRDLWRRAVFLGVIALLSVGLLVFTWLRVWSRLQQWRATLARAVAALHSTREDLEKRVTERTSELQAEVGQHKRTGQALRASEAHFRFLNDLTEETRALADPAQIMAVMARMLGEHLRASRCAYADVEKDAERFTILHDYTDGCASTAGNYQLSLFGARAVATLHGGQTLIIRNVEAELLPGEGADMFNAIGIKAIITCPLVKEGRLRAMMAVHQTTPRDWKPSEVAIVQQVVERCWASIERRKSEERLRESEALRRIAGHTARVGGWTVDLPEGRITWSDEVCAIHEVPAGTVPALDQAIHFYAPSSRETIRKAFETCARQGTPFDLELEIIGAKGHRVWVHSIGEAQRNAAGAITRVQGALQDITGRKQAELGLSQAHAQLLAVSRQAAIAEFATGILHNVGNVLNSVNVASSCVAESLRKSKAINLSKVVTLLREHEKDLGDFLTHDPKGRQVPVYLAHLAEHLTGEQTATLEELAQLQKHIEYIRDIITTQQGMAKTSRGTEMVDVAALVADALQMNLSGPAPSDIAVITEGEAVPPIRLEKPKLLQILANLVRNAKQSCEASGQREKKLRIHTTNVNGRVRIAVSDNGQGIAPENLPRIFTHGFTTKKDGHGFGLHSAVLAANEMGGSLSVHSDGLGRGATFTLELPCHRDPGANNTSNEISASVAE